MASSLAVHSSSTTMVGGGVGTAPIGDSALHCFGTVCGEMYDEDMLLAFSLSMLDCTTTSGEETEAEESIAER